MDQGTPHQHCEAKNGAHMCPDWDHLEICNLDPEWATCRCEIRTHHGHIKSCPEPHHEKPIDEKAHRAHHWRERLVCMSACLALHLFLEFGEKYIW